MKITKLAKLIDVEYFAGFGEPKKVRIRLDPGETKDDILRRLQLREKGEDITITNYFPIIQRRTKQFSLRDQAHQRNLIRIKERERRLLRKEEAQLQQNEIQELLNQIENGVSEDDFLESLRSKKVANSKNKLVK